MTSSRARRLHVAAVAAEALSQLRQLALPIIVLAFVGPSGGRSPLWYAALGLLLSVGAAWTQWRTTRWYLGDGEVRLRRGVFTENVTTIPLERVQAIDTVHGPIQRLFGVVEVDIQSAGGGRKGEIVLKAVTPAEVEELREAVRRASGVAPEVPSALERPEAPERPGAAASPATWRLGSRPLLVAALTSGSFGVLLPVVAGLSQVADDLLGREQAERLLPDTVSDVALLATGILLTAWLLSVLGTVVAFAGFTAVREGERLRIRRGVLERREASVPVARIHAVRVIESPLREPFGLAQVRIETAGYASEPATAQTLLPLVRRRDARAALRELLPELDAPLDDLAPVPRRALRRYVLPPMAGGALAAGALIAIFGMDALPALALVVAGFVVGLAWYRAAGWRLDGDRVVVRSRRLARTTATADARRLQSVGVSVSPLQRRARLASLSFAVSSGREFKVEELDGEVAGDLLGRLGTMATTPAGASSR